MNDFEFNETTENLTISIYKDNILVFFSQKI